MKKLLLTALMLIAMQWAWAETVPFGKGQLTVKYVARNAVRIQYDEGGVLPEQLPDWSYVMRVGYCPNSSPTGAM